MNKILVPTDFSSASEKSLDYASKIAEIMNASITLLWVDNIDTTSNLQIDTKIQTALRTEAKEELKELIDKATVLNSAIKYSTKIKTGKVFREVAALAQTEKSSMVVLSTNGGSGYEDFWIGSNAYRIISASPCPVISTKPTFTPSAKVISRILVPIDHTPDTLNKLPAILRFAKQFNAEVNIIAIYTTNLKTLNKKVDHSATTAQKMISEANLAFSYDEMKTENLVSDLVKFIEQSSIDLISIMTEQGNKDEQSGIGQIAKQVINRSPVPVLSVS